MILSTSQNSPHYFWKLISTARGLCLDVHMIMLAHFKMSPDPILQSRQLLRPKIDFKTNPENIAQKSPKSAPTRSQNGSQWEPNSDNLCKMWFQNAYKNTCPKSCKWCLSGSPPTPKTMRPPSREYSFHMFAYSPKVFQNGSQWHSFGGPWASQTSQKSYKGPLTNTLNKSMRVLMPPGIQNGPKMTSTSV